MNQQVQVQELVLSPYLVPEGAIGFVYALINMENNKGYIGKHEGKSIWTRWDRDLRGGNLHLVAAVAMYGVAAFRAEIIGYCFSRKELENLERLWIITTRFYDPEYGYNMTMGGEGFGILTPETRKRNGIAKRGKVSKKLKPIDVTNIRKLYVEGELQTVLAKMYNVSVDTIASIVKKHLWEWVDEKYQRPIENRCKTDRYLARMSSSMQEYWDAKSPEERKLEGQRRYEKQTENRVTKGQQNHYQLGKHWITNEIINKNVTCSALIPDGWQLCRQKPRIWITDGLITKSIPADKEIPNGFRRGRSRKK